MGVKLEQKLDRDLDSAVLVTASRKSKVGKISSVFHAADVESIKNVVSFEANLELARFLPHAELLEQCHIDIGISGASEHVPRQRARAR